MAKTSNIITIKQNRSLLYKDHAVRFELSNRNILHELNIRNVVIIFYLILKRKFTCKVVEAVDCFVGNVNDGLVVIFEPVKLVKSVGETVLSILVVVVFVGAVSPVSPDVVQISGQQTHFADG